MTEEFAMELRATRLGAGLTQDELAERSGVSQSNISALERGRGFAPTQGTLQRLQAVLPLDGWCVGLVRA